MPEGHTIHRLARDQLKTLVGQSVAITSPQGRFATGAALLTGRRLHAVEACGKHLFYRFDDESGPVLHIHLGLFGKYRTQPRVDPLPEPRGAVRVRFVSDTHVIDLAGPNQCEVLEPAEMQGVMDRLGPDPLRDDADPGRAWHRISRSRSTIGQLVMDQAVMSGVGNIYRTELLFRARLCPNTPGRQMTRQRFHAIWADAVKLLNIGVKYNRIITVDLKSAEKPASRLTYGERTLIFGKTQCPSCRGPITRFEIAKRRAFRCPQCQRPAAA
jgi:endonuclease-8